MNRTQQLERSPIHLLHRASQSVADLFAKEIKSDLTPRQLTILSTIARNEGCSQTDVVERTGIDRSTMADVVRRLVKKGLVERRRSKEDTRAYVMKLTSEGNRILKSAEPLAKRLDEKILRLLGSRGSAFLDILSTLAARLPERTRDRR